MNNFSYTARDAAGAMQRGIISAANRVGALQALKAQGLTPIELAESVARKEASSLSKVTKSVLLGGLAMGVLIIAAFRMMPDSKPKVQKQKNEVKKTEPERTVRTQTASVTPPVAASAPSSAPATQDPSTPKVLGPADRAKPLISQHPQRHEETVSEVPTNPPLRHLSSGTEQVISMIVNTRLGNPPPLLLRLPKGENIAEILDRDIVLYDDDSDKMIEAKTNVAYAKQLLKEYIQEGGKPEDFIEYYHSELTAAFNEWRTAQKYATDLIRAGDDAGALRYIEAQNKILSAKGIRPVTVFGLKK